MWNLKLPKVNTNKFNCEQLEIGYVYRGSNQMIVTPICDISGYSIGLNGSENPSVILILKDECGLKTTGMAYNPLDKTIVYELIGSIKEIVIE